MEVAELKMLRFDVVKEDMAEVEVTENIETSRDGKTAVATPDGKSRKKKNRGSDQRPSALRNQEYFIESKGQNVQYSCSK